MQWALLHLLRLHGIPVQDESLVWKCVNVHDVGNEQVLITAHTIIHRLHCEGGSYTVLQMFRQFGLFIM